VFVPFMFVLGRYRNFNRPSQSRAG
jgi:hypothetical protein